MMDRTANGTWSDVFAHRVSRRTALGGLAGGAAAGLLGSGGGRAAAQEGTPIAGTPPANDEVAMEWLGWSHFRFTSPNGTIILTNPFVENPDSPVTLEDMTQADLIFAADGHGDEIGSTVEIAQQTGALVFAPGELNSWFMEQGVPEEQIAVRFANPGDRYVLDGITLRMVSSIHGSGLPVPTAQNPYGGAASGVVITFENDWTVYFAGSTAATMDQTMWAEMYQPDLAILPLNGSREPMDFAKQVQLVLSGNPNLGMVMPHHHRVEPQPGQTTVAEAQAAIDTLALDIQITEPALDQVYRFPT
jgi:L-ascorbate metabolism protein UlaG (beta-lactamase superfamily)